MGAWNFRNYARNLFGNEFIDKIIIKYEIETAREEAKNGNFSSAEETEATIPKWLKDN